MAVGACFPKGFAAGVAACGMKRSGKADLALLVSDRPAAAAGVFTTNRVVAAPVTVSRAQVQTGTAQAVVTNSGCANACTGSAGREAAWTMVRETASALGIAPSRVLVASTGVIGRPLPIDDVVAGIHGAAAGLAGTNGRQAANAIRTTDRFPKLAQSQVELSGGRVRIGGMAKGAGMIRPDMATTLAQVTLDADVPHATLRRILRQAVADSFNAISVDGCTSTNDCVFMLANGASGVTVDGARQLRILTGAVGELMLDLAKQVVRDGEGSTRVCVYTVTGALSGPEARAAARGVAENVLVKCALHGGDPNWGRILAALGAAGVHLDPDRVAITVGGVPIVDGGEGVEHAMPDAKERLSKDEVEVQISLGLGAGHATVIASDLSPDYVHFNSAVTT
ncbi:MAG TPA: bifunctional glutamate N-acetyltransferase/amino-acid acetyltransferase ArgJ [Gaiellales bacterium]|nr:bifunctional glutamate N-acetyltransferase/amino-acid acetyltransferase ArgJ [Gaiellales bacterium]